jgi:hypothetical protein
MLNVQDHYTYKNKSIDKVNNKTIHSLSNKGFKEYLSNSSFANKFIDKSKLIKPKNFERTSSIKDDDIYIYENNRVRSNQNFNDYEKDKLFYSSHYLRKIDTEEIRKNMFNQLNEDKSYTKLVGRYKTSHSKNKLNTKLNKDGFSNSSNKLRYSLLGLKKSNNIDFENRIYDKGTDFFKAKFFIS